MPELPEVETIVRSLRGQNNAAHSLIGCRITNAHLFWERTLVTPQSMELLGMLIDQVILDIYRRGKFIVIHLTDRYLLVHLRMSGELRIEESPTAGLQNHDRLAIQFEDGFRLVFHDPRKFGRVWLLKDPMKVLGKLGPEPLGVINSAEFHERLAHYRRQLKPLLMDQSFLAGLGNIYTDEALFIAHLHPLSISNMISLENAETLLSAIRMVLEEGINQKGASIDRVYKGGGFQNTFRVYQQTNQPCHVCGSSIQRIVVGQRGTHFCPTCQKT